MPETISKNKFVTITYSISDEDDEILESNDIPTGYVHGHNSQVIEKIETSLEGHVAGDTVQVTLSPDEGFGPYQQELTFTDDLDNVPEEFHHIGAEVEFRNEQDESRIFRVIDIDGDKLTVDGNHPFAGRTVSYSITVKDVRDATPEELADRSHSSSSLH